MHFAINSNLASSQQIIRRLIQNLNQLEGKVARFTLFTSLDTVGAQAEYIRYGLNFENYIQNIETILTDVQWPIEISYMVTVNALSLEGLPELLRIVAKQRTRYPRHKISFDAPALRDPRHMSVKILPQEFRRHLIEALEVMKDGFQDWEIQKVDRIRTLMENDPYSEAELKLRRQDFFKMYTEYDIRRGTNFKKTFPNYAHFYESCGKL
jgi:hypothetical protein